MTEIHYFPRYTQAENFVTNNTLLLILRLHQYSRFKFEKFMELLCANSDIQLATSWLQFNQQRTTGRSVLDGFISQDSVKIAVETKLGPNFNSSQLRRHLDIFGEEQHKLLILLGPADKDQLGSIMSEVRAEADPRNIQILPASFEDIIRAARGSLSPHDEEMLALIDDYESFCSEEGLLPVDHRTLFVPPCSKSFEENKKFRLYYCPATWTRRDARFLGVYAQRSVRLIGRVTKVLACTIDLESQRATADGQIISAAEEERILGATIAAKKHGWDLTRGHKFYLCDSLEETDFRKHSRGGIMGHRYFDLQEVLGAELPEDVGKIAELLRGRDWPERSST